MLTLEKLKAMDPHSIFMTGVEMDKPGGLNMSNSGRELRWVATRGGIHDWAIYCHFSDKSPEWIQKHGDKVHDESNIKSLVNCTEEAFEMYRH